MDAVLVRVLQSLGHLSDQLQTRIERQRRQVRFNEMRQPLSALLQLVDQRGTNFGLG